MDFVIYLLQILKPNGMIVHRVNNIVFGLRGHKQLVEFRHPQDLTFDEYKETSPHYSYTSILRILGKAKNYVPI